MLDAQTIIALVALVISMPPTLAVLINWWRKSQRQPSSACQDGITIRRNRPRYLTANRVEISKMSISLELN